jgi:hypothetical protein
MESAANHQPYQQFAAKLLITIQCSHAVPLLLTMALFPN